MNRKKYYPGSRFYGILTLSKPFGFSSAPRYGNAFLDLADPPQRKFPGRPE
jgi:hypothetical protein